MAIDYLFIGLVWIELNVNNLIFVMDYSKKKSNESLGMLIFCRD